VLTPPVARPLCVVLVSGGMDSCVTAAIAGEEYEPAFLHVSYGQRTEERERRAFEQIAGHYQVRRILAVRLDALSAIGGSCLTDPAVPVPEPDLSGTKIPVSYVPFRNTHLLATAVSWAEVIGAGAVFIGAVEEDSSGYPDCRPSYFEAFADLICQGTRPETSIRICTPLIAMKKSEIVSRGLELGAPLELSWSCYQSSDAACGRCDSCALRLRAFAQAGARDPIDYARGVAKI
jgi:7-cyano-7-deazaguanine synthase